MKKTYVKAPIARAQLEIAESLNRILSSLILESIQNVLYSNLYKNRKQSSLIQNLEPFFILKPIQKHLP